MIRSFADKDTAKLWHRQRVKRFESVERTARRKLETVEAAEVLLDLAVPRVCFRWTEAGPEDVGIRGYHEPALEGTNMSDLLEPIHPGEILLEEFLTPLGITQHKLAVLIHVPPRRINEIVHGKRAITADTARRLSRFFGTSDQFWVNLQARYDLEKERDRIGPDLADIRPLDGAHLTRA